MRLVLTKILVVSDIHLGHKRTSTDYIIANLNSNIYYQIENNKIDVLFIAGDLFDRLLNANDFEISATLAWISSLFILCNKYNVAVRVLEGTPSHDWQQSVLFQTVLNILKNNHNISIDFKYFKDVTIEYLERLNMNVLYVPDEWGLTSEYTLNHVKRLMRDKNLEKVDLAIMHGMFDYQVASLPNTPFMKVVHNSAEYLNLVKRFIFIGHIHTHSHFDRIIAQGSFDRLAHGEEEPKGFVIAELYNDQSKDTFKFIENKNAKIYKTIEIKSKDNEKSLALINKIISKLPRDSYIRIVTQKNNPILDIWDKVINKIDGYYFSKKVIDENNKDNIKSIETFNHSGITINDKNIYDIVESKVKGLTIDNKIKDFALLKFKEIIEK